MLFAIVEFPYNFYNLVLIEFFFKNNKFGLPMSKKLLTNFKMKNSKQKGNNLFCKGFFPRSEILIAMFESSPMKRFSQNVMFQFFVLK